MKHDDILNALSVLCPGAAYTLNGDKLEWLDKVQKQPTLIEMQTACDKTAYQEKRRKEYPSIGDQLDAIWKIIAHGDFAELPGDAKIVFDKVMDVKFRHPKGE